MHIETLVAEIGSTTTLVNAFTALDGDKPLFLGQGQAPTTVEKGDVTIGLRQAISHLQARLGQSFTWETLLASSSAAGGLRMTVHGLVYDMTARAAREAALGAGAVITLITAGELTGADLAEIKEQDPNIILLAGGVDYGESATVLANARHLARLGLNAPIVYAGNVAAQRQFKEIMTEAGLAYYLTENVYPAVDHLNVEPTRQIIQKVFAEHIVQAPGMEKIEGLVGGPILPTPAAVLHAARVLREALGDLMVVDVGGATTDVHSVTPGSDTVNRYLLHPEPLAKRTVEGDLGVYINAAHWACRLGLEQLSTELGFDVAACLENWSALPKSAQEEDLLAALTAAAAHEAILRHAGSLEQLYGPQGRTTIAIGKDLSEIRYIIATGGPLTQIKGGRQLLQSILAKPAGKSLMPPPAAKILIDSNYNLASLGLLAQYQPRAALRLMGQSLAIARAGENAN